MSDSASDQARILGYLSAHNIAYKLAEHPAVFTVEESEKVDTGFTGIGTKNLFLRDKKATRHFLVVVEKRKQVDLKALETLLGCDRLSFGKPERLAAYLGVTPGSVTLLACANDPEHRVELFLDEDIANAPALTCHPLINTATVELSREAVTRFLASLGRTPNVIQIPLSAKQPPPESAE